MLFKLMSMDLWIEVLPTSCLEVVAELLCKCVYRYRDTCISFYVDIYSIDMCLYMHMYLQIYHTLTHTDIHVGSVMC